MGEEETGIKTYEMSFKNQPQTNIWKIKFCFKLFLKKKIGPVFIFNSVLANKWHPKREQIDNWTPFWSSVFIDYIIVVPSEYFSLWCIHNIACNQGVNFMFLLQWLLEIKKPGDLNTCCQGNLPLATLFHSLILCISKLWMEDMRISNSCLKLHTSEYLVELFIRRSFHHLSWSLSFPAQTTG